MATHLDSTRALAEKTVKRNLARTIMASKGITARDLAKKTGLSYPYVRHLICGTFTHTPGRRKIEASLGFPIWTPADVFYAARVQGKKNQIIGGNDA